MKDIRQLLFENGLKITPQRVAVYEAITKMKNHPNAENIIDYIKEIYPNIAVGTVYNTLETFVEKGIITRMKTAGDVMRYDGITKRHQHLYSADSKRIEDYYDDEINEFITEYMNRKKIPNFTIEDISVQIIGQFKK